MREELDVVTRLLVRLRICDPDGSLSLTSCVLMVAVVKFACAPLQTETLIALLGALSAHQGKKLINQRTPSAGLESKVAALEAAHTDAKTRLQVVENRTRPTR